MAIVQKSLHHGNITVIFKPERFVMPENADLGGVYRGAEAQGARLTDDAVLGAKVLTLPAIGHKLTLERNRVRFDDETGAEPDKTRLHDDTRKIFDALFSQTSIDSWGFNYDIYFRTRDVIFIQNIFKSYFGEKALDGATLMDTGIQFTLDRRKYQEVWFLKITAPLEIAAHVNFHFSNKELPTAEVLKKMFIECYNKTDDLMAQFAHG